MFKRWAQPEQMREFFIQMWLQNPALARQGENKVQKLLAPLVDSTEEIFLQFLNRFDGDIEGDGK